MPLPAVRLGEPEPGQQFSALTVAGVRVFVSPALLREGELRLSLMGWGPFRYLQVQGVKIFT
ncbi:MAG TPA: hypothetical protein GX511_08330 [Firmicutes bacterium]|nr:hypothetical protein [Bacillota bacterium]